MDNNWIKYTLMLIILFGLLNTVSGKLLGNFAGKLRASVKRQIFFFNFYACSVKTLFKTNFLSVNNQCLRDKL